MCGIIGYVGERRAAPVILDGLRRLYYLELLDYLGLLLHLMYPKSLTNHLFHLNLKHLELLLHLMYQKNLMFHLNLSYQMFQMNLNFHLNLMFHLNLKFQMKLIERLMLKNKLKK